MYRGINDFKKDYQPRTNIVKMRSIICLQTPRLFWVGGGTISLAYLMYMGLMILSGEKYRRELVIEVSAFEIEMAVEKIKSHKLQGIDQIPGQLITAGSRTIPLSSRNLKVLFGIRRKCVSSGRIRSLYLSIRKVMKQIAVRGICIYQLRAKFYTTSCCQG